MRPLYDQFDPSSLGSWGDAALQTLDLPGSLARGALRSGSRLWQGQDADFQRTSPEELAETWGWGPMSNLGSMGLAMATDPLSYLGALGPALRLARGVRGLSAGAEAAEAATPFLKSQAFGFGAPLAGAAMLDANQEAQLPGWDMAASALMMSPLAIHAPGMIKGAAGRFGRMAGFGGGAQDAEALARGLQPSADEFTANRSVGHAMLMPATEGYEGSKSYARDLTLPDFAAEHMQPAPTPRGQFHPEENQVMPPEAMRSTPAEDEWARRMSDIMGGDEAARYRPMPEADKIRQQEIAAENAQGLAEQVAENGSRERRGMPPISDEALAAGHQGYYATEEAQRGRDLLRKYGLPEPPVWDLTGPGYRPSNLDIAMNSAIHQKTPTDAARRLMQGNAAADTQRLLDKIASMEANPSSYEDIERAAELRRIFGIPGSETHVSPEVMEKAAYDQLLGMHRADSEAMMTTPSSLAPGAPELPKYPNAGEPPMPGGPFGSAAFTSSPYAQEGGPAGMAMQLARTLMPGAFPKTMAGGGFRGPAAQEAVQAAKLVRTIEGNPEAAAAMLQSHGYTGDPGVFAAELKKALANKETDRISRVLQWMSGKHAATKPPPAGVQKPAAKGAETIDEAMRRVAGTGDPFAPKAPAGAAVPPAHNLPPAIQPAQPSASPAAAAPTAAPATEAIPTTTKQSPTQLVEQNLKDLRANPEIAEGADIDVIEAKVRKALAAGGTDIPERFNRWMEQQTYRHLGPFAEGGDKSGWFAHPTPKVRRPASKLEVAQELSKRVPGQQDYASQAVYDPGSVQNEFTGTMPNEAHPAWLSDPAGWDEATKAYLAAHPQQVPGVNVGHSPLALASSLAEGGENPSAFEYLMAQQRAQQQALAAKAMESRYRGAKMERPNFPDTDATMLSDVYENMPLPAIEAPEAVEQLYRQLDVPTTDLEYLQQHGWPRKVNSPRILAQELAGTREKGWAPPEIAAPSRTLAEEIMAQRAPAIALDDAKAKTQPSTMWYPHEPGTLPSEQPRTAPPHALPTPAGEGPPRSLESATFRTAGDLESAHRDERIAAMLRNLESAPDWVLEKAGYRGDRKKFLSDAWDVLRNGPVERYASLERWLDEKGIQMPKPPEQQMSWDPRMADYEEAQKLAVERGDRAAKGTAGVMREAGAVNQAAAGETEVPWAYREEKLAELMTRRDTLQKKLEQSQQKGQMGRAHNQAAAIAKVEQKAEKLARSIATAQKQWSDQKNLNPVNLGERKYEPDFMKSLTEGDTEKALKEFGRPPWQMLMEQRKAALAEIGTPAELLAMGGADALTPSTEGLTADQIKALNRIRGTSKSEGIEGALAKESSAWQHSKEEGISTHPIEFKRKVGDVREAWLQDKTRAKGAEEARQRYGLDPDEVMEQWAAGVEKEKLPRGVEAQVSRELEPIENLILQEQLAMYPEMSQMSPEAIAEELAGDINSGKLKRVLHGGHHPLWPNKPAPTGMEAMTKRPPESTARDNYADTQTWVPADVLLPTDNVERAIDRLPAEAKMWRQKTMSSMPRLTERASPAQEGLVRAYASELAKGVAQEPGEYARALEGVTEPIGIPPATMAPGVPKPLPIPPSPEGIPGTSPLAPYIQGYRPKDIDPALLDRLMKATGLSPAVLMAMLLSGGMGGGGALAQGLMGREYAGQAT